MTALPLDTPALKLASSAVPAPIRQLLRRAELAEPPATVRDLHLDTDHGAGAEKVLMRFTAERGDVNLFLLLSPGLKKTDPQRFDELGRSPPWRVGSEGGPPRRADLEDGEIEEPDFPWWNPGSLGPGRRFTYSTREFDFVEVIISDLTSAVFIRAIN